MTASAPADFCLEIIELVPQPVAFRFECCGGALRLRERIDGSRRAAREILFVALADFRAAGGAAALEGLIERSTKPAGRTGEREHPGERGADPGGK